MSFRRNRDLTRRCVTLAFTSLLAIVGHAAPVALPSLVINPNEVSVSGLSSGGFMAVQLHVAYSATFKKGAGVVAGGPYFCAEGSVSNATGRCMAATGAIPVNNLISTTNSWAQSGLIDATSNLQQSKVYLFTGSADSVVKSSVMSQLRTYYQNYIPAANVLYKADIAAEHAMITDDHGSTCSTKGSPYINDCNFDLAGAMLQQIYGPLNPRNNGTLGGQFVEFDQTAFISNHGMATSGWAYIPQSCSAGTTTCRLHVVLHGCKQNTADIGTQYVQKTGYNRWADTNNIVLLYPQTSLSATNSCWDWWGYDNPNYAKKSGPQMAAIKGMVDRVSSGTPPSNLGAPTNLVASNATNTSMQLNWTSVNGASGYNVYRGASRVNATLVTSSAFTDSNLSPGTAYTWTVKAVDSNAAESPASNTASGSTTGSAATCFTASNYAHVTAGRAYNSLGYAKANGSNQNMGLNNLFVTTTLKRTGPNYYVIGTCP